MWKSEFHVQRRLIFKVGYVCVYMDPFMVPLSCHPKLFNAIECFDKAE